MKNDLISRQAAIDALCSVCGGDCDKSKFVYGGKQEDQVILCPEHYVLTQLPSVQPEPTTEIQEILNYLDTTLHPIVSPDNWNVYAELHDMVSKLPSAQPERTCVNCGRTVNNGGWYADGGTRCPIEEHYALPKDGYCHLWEKRNVTDDDYPERRTDEGSD